MTFPQPHMVLLRGGNAATLAKAFLSVGHPFALKDVSQKGLIKERFSLILEASKRNLIFSSELFSMLTKESVNDLKSFISDFDYEIFFIIYLRRHDQIVESDYAQQVKQHGYSPKIDKSFYSRITHSYNFENLISNFETNFGFESAIVRIYEKQYFFNNNLLHDFLLTIGLQDSLNEFIEPVFSINPSPSRKVLEVMRLINQVGGYSNVNKAILELVFQDVSLQKKSEESYITFEDKMEILSSVQDMYKRVAQKYFKRDKLFYEVLEPYELNSLSNLDITETILKVVKCS